MSDTILLTGATGFIGRYLLWTWLNRTNGAIILLARSRRERSAAQRIGEILLELAGQANVERLRGRVEVFEGDVAETNLGMDRATREELSTRVTSIIHCAAAARFDLPIEEARRVNVGGVHNLLEFASRCSHFSRLDYVGTAYVAGERKGLVHETDLDVGQAHRNTYERSKFEAEKLLSDAMSELPICVMRPSIVICDSQTGRGTHHNGFYRAMAAYLSGVAPAFPGSPDSVLDIVPVDYVADVVFALHHAAHSVGNRYHLVAGPQRMSTLGEVRDLAALHSGRPKFGIIPPEQFAVFAANLPADAPEAQRKLANEITLLLPYLRCECWFDDSNTRRDTGLQAPLLRTYFDKLVKFILQQPASR